MVMVPNTLWTGYETDLLVVEKKGLRLVDIEIKVSRSDFRRDADKSKWWREPDLWQWDMGPPRPRMHRTWPEKVWKHYFAMPAAIWTDDLVEALPSPASGVLLFKESERGCLWWCERRAKPNKEADPISAANVFDIARLANLRMWDALADAERLRAREKSVADRAAELAGEQSKELAT